MTTSALSTTTDQRSNIPTILSPEATVKIARLREATYPDGQDHYSISSALAPAPEARGWLERRSAAISGWLRPADPEAITRPLDVILGSMRVQIDHEEDADARRAAYLLALSDLPAWAVERACTAALRGKIGDGTGRYAPGPGELHVVASGYVRTLVREQADIERILRAIVVEPIAATKEERAAVIARVRKMRDDVVEAAKT